MITRYMVLEGRGKVWTANINVEVINMELGIEDMKLD